MPKITVETIVDAPMELVWECWTAPKHITQWCHASDDWEAPNAENDLEIGGKFKTVMASKDKKVSFDFGGTYTDIKEEELIEYVMNGEDAREVKITFTEVADGIKVTETFDAETVNPLEKQRNGWQAIMDNFKKYTESKK
jgi:uncharacterized protein YndB with AHSA1/START domain